MKYQNLKKNIIYKKKERRNMENITKLIEEYKNNFEKLEKITKEQQKQEQNIKTVETEQSENFYKLQDKLINAQDYLVKCEELKTKKEKAKEKNDILLIEKKLLQDNENIINDKIIIDIFKNIILKYEGKAIGESTTTKIDNEIKNYLQPLYDKKYIYIYTFNEYSNILPNQFINLYECDYSFSNYQKKLSITLTSLYNRESNYKQKIYIKENQFLLNEYSKLEEKEQDNKANIERIENTQIIQDTKAKAKEIYKAYKKKVSTLERLKKEEEQAKKDFDNMIKDNQNTFYHNIYSYFYR